MKTDAEFIAALEGSKPAVNAVYKWASKKGFNLFIPETKIRPHVNERVEYMDDGDILVTKRLEVKGTSYSFTTLKNYPFDSVLFDESYKVDKRRPQTLSAYMIVNTELTHAIMIKPDSRHAWYDKRIYDSKDKQYNLCKFCPKELTEIVKL